MADKTIPPTPHHLERQQGKRAHHPHNMGQNPAPRHNSHLQRQVQRLAQYISSVAQNQDNQGRIPANYYRGQVQHRDQGRERRWRNPRHTGMSDKTERGKRTGTWDDQPVRRQPECLMDPIRRTDEEQRTLEQVPGRGRDPTV